MSEVSIDESSSLYDFSKGVKNPYAKKLKKQITIRGDEDPIDYFKALSEELAMPYQSLTNLYLKDYADRQRKLNLSWKESPSCVTDC